MSDGGTTFTFVVNVVEATCIAIGMIGNFICILIFSRKTFRNNSISTYCIALGLIESLSVFEFIDAIGILKDKVNLSDQSDTNCKLIYYMDILLSGCQAWIMVSFGVDKLLNMRTSSTPIITKKWFQWSLVVGIILFNILLYIYVPILLKRAEVSPNFYLCDFATMGFSQIFMIVFLLESCLIPFIVMIIISILTIRLLYKSRKSIERIGVVAAERKTRDKKYAISSVTLNIMFIVLKLPMMMFYTLFSFDNYFDVYYYRISIYLFFLNSSLSIFVHLVTNSLFRREFMVFFRLSKRNQETSRSMNSNTTSRTIIPVSKNQVPIT
jgi:hypothetical protein